MSFLLDTNVLSAHFRRPSQLASRFFQYSGRLYTSTVALAELFVWAHNRPDATSLLNGIDQLLFREVAVLDFDRDCADELITSNTADFQRIPGLQLDDWLKS